MANFNLSLQRTQLLRRFENLVELPMIILALVWLIILIVELVKTMTPALEITALVIWIIFIAEFTIRFILTTAKLKFLKSNVLTLISLVVPALRLFRIFRVLRLLRFSRSFRLVKVLGSINRGIRALSATMQRRAFGYVVALTALVLFVGAAGMYAFEKGEGITSYSTSLWWTLMLLTTMGSEYWPKTVEGRILCIFLALYAFTMFGYVTASIATFFIGQDAESSTAKIAGSNEISELRKEIFELKALLINSALLAKK